MQEHYTTTDNGKKKQENYHTFVVCVCYVRSSDWANSWIVPCKCWIQASYSQYVDCPSAHARIVRWVHMLAD